MTSARWRRSYVNTIANDSISKPYENVATAERPEDCDLAKVTISTSARAPALENVNKVELIHVVTWGLIVFRNHLGVD